MDSEFCPPTTFEVAPCLTVVAILFFGLWGWFRGKLKEPHLFGECPYVKTRPCPLPGISQSDLLRECYCSPMLPFKSDLDALQIGTPLFFLNQVLEINQSEEGRSHGQNPQNVPTGSCGFPNQYAQGFIHPNWCRIWFILQKVLPPRVIGIRSLGHPVSISAQG